MPRLTVDDSILAISDVHTAPAGRLLAQKLLNTGVVSVFFMEWSKPIDPRNVTDSFTGLSPNDARPNLRGLATICAAENIEMAFTKRNMRSLWLRRVFEKGELMLRGRDLVKFWYYE